MLLSGRMERSLDESRMKRLVIDLDDTLTIADAARSYSDVDIRPDVVARLREYKTQGFEIVIHTARNMRTFEGSVGKITVHTLPVITQWLDKHDIPYDEIWLGKPWCGKEGFYVDDKAVRPDEFASLSYEQIKALVNIE